MSALPPSHPRFFAAKAPKKKLAKGARPVVDQIAQIKQAAAREVMASIVKRAKTFGIKLKNTAARANARMGFSQKNIPSSPPVSIRGLLERMK
jgi:hypothetical protein